MMLVLSTLLACSACARKEEAPEPPRKAEPQPLGVPRLPDSAYGTAVKDLAVHRSKITMLLVRGKRAEVRPEAEAIALGAAALPSHASALDPADQAVVTQEAATLAERARNLADVAEKGEPVAAGAALRALNETLDHLVEIAR